MKNAVSLAGWRILIIKPPITTILIKIPIIEIPNTENMTAGMSRSKIKINLSIIFIRNAIVSLPNILPARVCN